jgi:hypothetical protein
MSVVITILGLASITNLWIHSEPSNHFRMWLYKDIKNKDHKWHWRLINCSLCVGFWIGLIFTLDILLAALVSVSAEFICKKLTEGTL